MRLILLRNVIACSKKPNIFQEKKKKKTEKDKCRDICVSVEELSRYEQAQLLHTNTEGLDKVPRVLKGLKHALVFQLCCYLADYLSY